MSSGAAYVWGTGLTEQQRLLQQIELYVPEASWMLNHLKIRPGSRAIDLGCGLLGILDLLSERVGPQGDVVGLEWESKFVEMANELLRGRKLENVRVMVGDATSTGLPDQSFQFVHERLLLIVVPEPLKVISEMVRLVAPGGIVAVEDVDLGTWTCEPSHPAWTRLFAAFEAVYTRDGKDLRVGRRLPGLLRAAGLDNVGCKAHARLNGPGDFHQQQLLVFVKLFWQQIIDAGLLTEEELQSAFRQLEDHLADPATLVVSPLLFQAWGYKTGDRSDRL
jgi:SAM-dependent methyltransferase